MTNLIEKISSYNLFNYLLPGILFAAIGDFITDYSIVQDDILIGLFLYYFLGLVISRVGSLILAPLLRWFGLVKLAPYGDFLRACRDDEKIELLSEQNNMYRTLCAMCVALGALKLFEIVATSRGVTPETATYILLVLLFVVFIASYRKQTDFIRKRVELVNEQTPRRD